MTLTEPSMQSLEHLTELRQRMGLCLTTFLFFIISIFLSSSEILYMFQNNISYVKIIPIGMGDYLYISLKLAISFGTFFTVPFSLYQLLMYFLPGFTMQEKKSILPTSYASMILFFFGLVFCKLYLIPATLNFLIVYSSVGVENTCKLDTYVDILLIMTVITGIFFQVPTIQFIVGYVGIISGKSMLKVSRYVIVLCSFLAAVVTPSTDPYPQILLSIAVSSLYLGGAMFIKFIKR